MPTVSSTCIRHPQTAAKRKCYRCLAHICPACQRRALGHIFCSVRCQILHWISERFAAEKRAWLRLSLTLRRWEKSVVRHTGGGTARLVSIGLLFAILYQTGDLVRSLRDFPPPPVDPAVAAITPAAKLEREGEYITVSGSAPGFQVAVLLTDDGEKELSSLEGGLFSFRFRPGPDERFVQVQVYGDRLPALFTKAIPLPVAGPPPREEASEGRNPEPDPQPARAAPNDLGGPHQEGAASSGRYTAPEDLSRGRSDTRTVAITFDGGSLSNSCPRILDVLADRGLKATFFLTGEFMNRFPVITRRIAGEGHEVGNHTFTHPHLTTYAENLRHNTLPGVTGEKVIEELKRNEDLFQSLTGHRMVKLWRAPYGEQNATIRRWAAQAGYRHVSWTFDPKTRKSLDGLDWVSDRDSALYLSSDEIIDKILSFDSDTEMGLAGGIVLLHLGSERSLDPFHAKFEHLLDSLQEKGYKVGSVGDLLQTGG